MLVAEDGKHSHETYIMAVRIFGGKYLRAIGCRTFCELLIDSFEVPAFSCALRHLNFHARRAESQGCCQRELTLHSWCPNPRWQGGRLHPTG